VLGRGVEVAGLVPEQEVGRRQGRRGGALAEVPQVVGEEDERAEDERDEDHGEQGREDASHPALVEGQEGEAARLEVAQDDRGDQVAGDDEEHVDADEAAAEGGNAGVEEQDRTTATALSPSMSARWPRVGRARPDRAGAAPSRGWSGRGAPRSVPHARPVAVAARVGRSSPAARGAPPARPPPPRPAVSPVASRSLILGPRQRPRVRRHCAGGGRCPLGGAATAQALGDDAPTDRGRRRRGRGPGLDASDRRAGGRGHGGEAMGRMPFCRARRARRRRTRKARTPASRQRRRRIATVSPRMGRRIGASWRT
jgi:hypothetical protein